MNIYFYMFNFKTIPKHSFLDGSPFWYISSRQYGYIDEETGQINIPYNDNIHLTNTDVFPGTESLVTEERVREIFREEYYNVLREDTENSF